MALKPLEGVRVLDFTNLPPGAFATVMLADLGAEIVRVEPPAQKGKPSLVIGQVPLSRAKRSMTLDMRNPAAAGILERIVPRFDVVIENAKPGTMEARGFGYGQANAANARIVWCALTGFGQEGPYAHHAAHDISFLSHSGLLSALSPELPWHPALPLALQAGAQAAVIGIQAGLLQAARTGEGAFVDISLSEAAGWLLTCGMNALSDKPFHLPVSPDRRLYACADGRYVAVASAEPRAWTALCEGLDLPDLIDALHNADRAAEATEKLGAAFSTAPATEWAERLAPLGAAVTVVNGGAQLLTDPHALARGSFSHCTGVPLPTNPVRMSRPGSAGLEMALTAPPTVGEHTEEILRSADFSDDEITALASAQLV